MAESLIGKAVEAVTTPTETTKALVQLGSESAPMGAAAEVRARRTYVAQRLMAMPFIPIARMLGLGGDYFDVPFREELAEKLAQVPEEDLIEPSPRVAVPAMEGLAMSLDEPELRDLFLNLIASASDRRSEEVVHPSFADVIRQMSAAEASLFAHVARRVQVPCVELRYSSVEGQGYVEAVSHVLEHGLKTGDSWEPTASAVDNWARLGLVNVDYGKWFTGEGAYDWVKRSAVWRRTLETVPPDRVLDFGKGALSLTARGRAFAKAVLPKNVVLAQ